MITHTEPKYPDLEKDIQEASLEIEQSMTELKLQCTKGLEKAHHYLEMTHSPLILLGSALRIGIFIGERIGSVLEGRNHPQTQIHTPNIGDQSEKEDQTHPEK